MPEGYVLIAVYLFIYFVCMRIIRKTKKILNRIAWNLVGGMIVYYPGTSWLDFGIDRVKGQGQRWWTGQIFLNHMEFGGMICYYPGTIWLDFGMNRVKGQGQGPGKVNIFFLP